MMAARALLGHLDVSVGPSDRQVRITWLSIGGLLLAAVLAVAGGLPFDLPMPTHLVGWVDPTCGLTRGSTAIARGDMGLAWRYNPASFAVMGFGLLGLLRAAVGFLAGRWVNFEARVGPLGWAVFLVVIVLLGLHQQSNAQFVMDARL
ncbi:MAG: DUF2752 domain-containing protein [Aquihabitans sp.]